MVTSVLCVILTGDERFVLTVRGKQFSYNPDITISGKKGEYNRVDLGSSWKCVAFSENAISDAVTSIRRLNKSGKDDMALQQKLKAFAYDNFRCDRISCAGVCGHHFQLFFQLTDGSTPEGRQKRHNFYSALIGDPDDDTDFLRKQGQELFNKYLILIKYEQEYFKKAKDEILTEQAAENIRIHEDFQQLLSDNQEQIQYQPTTNRIIDSVGPSRKKNNVSPYTPCASRFDFIHRKNTETPSTFNTPGSSASTETVEPGSSASTETAGPVYSVPIETTEPFSSQNMFSSTASTFSQTIFSSTASTSSQTMFSSTASVSSQTMSYTASTSSQTLSSTFSVASQTLPPYTPSVSTPQIQPSMENMDKYSSSFAVETIQDLMQEVEELKSKLGVAKDRENALTNKLLFWQNAKTEADKLIQDLQNNTVEENFSQRTLRPRSVEVQTDDIPVPTQRPTSVPIQIHPGYPSERRCTAVVRSGGLPGHICNKIIRDPFQQYCGIHMRFLDSIEDDLR